MFEFDRTITDGISREDWTQVEKASLLVAEYPKPPTFERIRILKFVGINISTFNDIGAQSLTVNTNENNLNRSIAPARTFCFLDQIRKLQRQGLALGGTLSNAILVDNDRIVNHEGLRFKDEFVHHKVLDAIGDLALAGAPIIGHYQAFKGGHLLNNLLINKLFTDKSSWSYISMTELDYFHEKFAHTHHKHPGHKPEFQSVLAR